MGLAMALPSTVLAVAWVVLGLIDKGVIGYGVGITIILAVIANIFFLMFRHLSKNRDRADD